MSRLSFFGLMLAVLVFSHCSGLSRGDDIDSERSDLSTNSLADDQPMDLFLDQIHFEGHLGNDVLYNNHPDFEIHLLSEDKSTLLACVGPGQKESLNAMGEAVITYGEIGARFVSENGEAPDADSHVVVRLVEKNSSYSCPHGFIGTDFEEADGASTVMDMVLGEETLAYGDLTGSVFDLEGVAQAGLRRQSQESWPIDPTPAAVNGILSADQIRLQESYDFGESSSPELVLAVYESGADTPIACADLPDVDSDDLFYGTMHYDFVDADGNELRSGDFNEATSYVIKLIELDNGDCRDFWDVASGLGIAVLRLTGELGAGELAGAPVSFSGSDDEVLLVWR